MFLSVRVAAHRRNRPTVLDTFVKNASPAVVVLEQRRALASYSSSGSGSGAKKDGKRKEKEDLRKFFPPKDNKDKEVGTGGFYGNANGTKRG